MNIVIVGHGPGVSDVHDELSDAFNEADIVTFSDAADVAANLTPDKPVPVVCIVGEPTDDHINSLAGVPQLAGARVLLITTAGDHRDVARAVDAGLVDAFVAVPLTHGFLAEHVRSQISRWARLHQPPSLDLNSGTGEQVQRVSPAFHTDYEDQPSSELLRDIEASPHVVEAELIAAIERALGPRPRLRLPAGVRLTRQGSNVDGVFVVLSGRVALTRHTEAEDLLLHHASTGPVVGLMSLSRSQKAYFTATTTTDVEVIHLSMEQLDRALTIDPEVGAALAAVAIRGLASRLQRAEQLQVERNNLNIALEQERSSLARALADLEAARLELIAQARFATLGELAAGIAHELNNPIAAMTSHAGHLEEDLAALLADHPHGRIIEQTVQASRARAPRSTAAERQLRRRLEKSMDPALAWRLVTAGVQDEQQAHALAAGGEEAVSRFEHASRIGAQIRGIDVSARRVTALVASLRAYARPEDQSVVVAVEETLDDTLQLVSHRLREVDVIRAYGTTTPLACYPSQLGQVWTNVIVNAAEALSSTPNPTITITTAMQGEMVRVQIEDNGPGIPPEILDRVFQPHFTTKGGQVRFGLGMGLGLASHIVHDHHGTITIDSRPGCTRVTTIVPVAPSERIPS
ncbi:MAG: ATP-binding protein [Bowdeniella nasicola]|nr:ATP-binding protein [Bowdeniella nasicola]